MSTPQRFGRYLLVKRLAAGGMAEVFLARTLEGEGEGRLVAVKRVLSWASEDRDFATMFLDEARISSRLQHANIARVFEFGQEQRHFYLAMEYVPGQDLRAIQAHVERTGRPLPVPLVLYIGAQLCQALSYAHRQKGADGSSLELIHRDVSPPNVLLSYDGTVKLIDFGIAKARSRATRTRAGQLKGKIAYMSPEQVQGVDIDHRSDIFSLGILLFEVLCGRKLFTGKSQIATMHEVRRAEVPLPSSVNPQVPPAVDAILLKALARDRQRRYQSAAQMLQAIERFAASQPEPFSAERLTAWMAEQFPEELAEEQAAQRRASGEADPRAGAPARSRRGPGTQPGHVSPGWEDAGQDNEAATGKTLPFHRPVAPARSSKTLPFPAPVAPSPPSREEVANLFKEERPMEGGGERRGPRKTPVGRAAPGGGLDYKATVVDQSLNGTSAPDDDSDEDPTPVEEMPPLEELPTQMDGGGEYLEAKTQEMSAVPPWDPDPEDAPTTLDMPPLPEDHGGGLADDDDDEEGATDLHIPTLAGGGFGAVGGAAEPEADPTEVDRRAVPPGRVVAAGDARDKGIMVGGSLDSGGGHGSMPGRGPRHGVVAPGDDRDRAAAGGSMEIEVPPPVRGPRSGAIAPGDDRDRAVAGGSLDSGPGQPAAAIVVEPQGGVSVEGVDDGLATGYFRRPPPEVTQGPARPTQRIALEEPSWTRIVTAEGSRRPSTPVIAVAAALALLVLGLVLALVLRSRGGSAVSDEYGTVVVGTEPAAACTVSLDKTPKGLLSPGATRSLPKVAPGDHALEVVCMGYQTYRAKVTVEAGEVAYVEAMLKKAK